MNSLKQDFPLLQNRNIAYLDSGATTQKPKMVIDAITNFYENLNANPHRGAYNLSIEATNIYESTRNKIARFLNTRHTDETIFSKNASESLNLVANSYGIDNVKKDDKIVLSIMEHHSNLVPWQKVCKETGAKLEYMYIDKNYEIPEEEIISKITDNTKIVAITHVSNVLGTINDVKKIIKYAHKKGAVVVVDASQSIPHTKIDVQDLDCDFLAFSGHKMLAPLGIGVLYGKLDLLEKMPPIEFGGDMADTVLLDSQTYKAAPYKFETGTPIIAGAIGLAAACKYIESIGFDNIIKQEKTLRAKAIEELKKIDGVIIYNESCETGVIAFNLDGIHPHDAASVFDNNDVCIRAGHHCAQLITKKLGTIGTIRASFYFYNREEDIEKFIKAVKEAKDFFGQF